MICYSNNITRPSFKTIVFVLLLIIYSSILQNLKAQALKDYAKAINLYFGSPTQGLSQRMQDSLSYNYNFTIPGNSLKYDQVEPSQGKFNFKFADSVVDFAQKHGIKVKGHCLIWHWSEPGWLWYYSVHGNPTRKGMLKIMKTHIDSVVGHFKGRISEWDVVNEAILDSPVNGNCLKSTHWQSIIGNDYIDSAFVFAHRADPKAYLYLNDYGGEMIYSGEKQKSDTIYSFVKRMVERGIPIHGVGMESHINNYAAQPSVAANIKRLGDLGLRVAMTETDMMHASNPPTAWTNMVTAAVANYNFTTFVAWGLYDSTSWKGSNCDCLIWDSMFKRKPTVYTAVKNALVAANKKTAILRGRFQAIPADDRFPDIPNNLIAIPNTKTILLRWRSALKALTYTVERSTTAGGPYANIATGIIDTFYTDTTAKAGINYFYVVVAVNPFFKSNFSNQVLSSLLWPLPNEILSFDIIQTKQGIRLSWMFDEKSKMNSYQVLRSNDGMSFLNISDKYNFDSISKEYTYFDDYPLLGKNYYKIVSINAEGDKLYSKTKFIAYKSDKSELGFDIFPNPAHSVANLEFKKWVEGEIKIEVLNLTGNKIFSENMILTPFGQKVFSLNTTKIGKGVFIVHITGANITNSIKLVVE